MKIKTLKLSNFSSHMATEVNFTCKLSCFVGGLNAGKSSIAQAIEFFLTGRCEGYRKKTSIFTDLIHDLANADRFSVSMHGTIGKGIRGRTKERQVFFELDGESQSDEKAQEALLAKLGVKSEIIEACFNTTDFFDWEAKDQSDLILGVIGAEVTTEKLLEAFKGGESAKTTLASYEIQSIADLDRAYKAAYEERTEANRVLRQYNPVAIPVGEAPNIPKMKERLTGEREQEKQFIARIAVLEGQRQGSQAATEKDLKEKIAQLDKWLKDNSEDGLKDRLQRKYDEARVARDKYEEQKGQLETRRAELAVAVSRAEADIKRVKSFTGTCFATDSISCPKSKADMAAALEDLGAGLRDLEKDSQQIKTKLAALVKPAPTTPEEVMAEVEAGKARFRVWREKEKELNELREKQKTAQNTPAANEEENPELKDLRAKLAVVTDNITRGDIKIDEAETWIRDRDKSEEIDRTRRRAEEKRQILEQLVEFFGPKGVRLQLIREKTDTFEQSLNRYLGPLGFTMEIQVEPWDIRAKSRSGKRLSRSERFRAGIALQIALAQWSGFRTVIIDNTEILPPPMRQTALAMLRDADLDQAIVISTLMVPPEEFQAPPIDWCKFYLVSNTEGVSEVRAL